MREPLSNTPVPAAWNEHLNNEEILQLLKISHRKFYYRPRVVARAMAGLQSKEEFMRLARGGLSLLKMERLSAKSHNAPV